MSGQQQVVAAGGAGLVAIAFWTGDGRKKIKAGLFSSGADAAAQQAAHVELTKLGGAVLFVGVATLLSGLSASWGAAMTAVVVGLFILWAINHNAK